MRFQGLIYGLLLFTASWLRAGEVLDRILVTVNGHAILQSDLDEELRYEAVMSGHEQRGTISGDRKIALDRLVDRGIRSTRMKLRVGRARGSRARRGSVYGRRA